MAPSLALIFKDGVISSTNMNNKEKKRREKKREEKRREVKTRGEDR